MVDVVTTILEVVAVLLVAVSVAVLGWRCCLPVGRGLLGAAVVLLSASWLMARRVRAGESAVQPAACGRRPRND